MSKEKLSTNDIFVRHQKITRLVSVLLIVCGTAAYYLSAMAYADPSRNYPIDTNYALQNAGIALIFAQVVLALVLKNLHGSIYWYFWLQLKKVTLTKHEQQVRQRVFARSYGYAIVVAVLALIQANVIAHFDSFASGDLLPKLIWIVFIFLTALPSIVASWEKYEEQV